MSNEINLNINVTLDKNLPPDIFDEIRKLIPQLVDKISSIKGEVKNAVEVEG